MKFTKESNWSFTSRMMNNGGNNSGTVTERGIPRSVMNSARVDKEEVRQMMDELEVWLAERAKGGQFAPGPKYATHPVHLAGLWMPQKEFARYPTDKLSTDIEANSAKLNEMIQDFVSLKQQYMFTNSIITDAGDPALNLEQLDWLIQRYEAWKGELSQHVDQNWPKDPVWQTLADCDYRIAALQTFRKQLIKQERLALRYQGTTFQGAAYIRIGSEVWLNNPQLRWIFEQRAIGADRRARHLREYLSLLQNPAEKGLPEDWDLKHGRDPNAQQQNQNTGGGPGPGQGTGGPGPGQGTGGPGPGQGTGGP